MSPVVPTQPSKPRRKQQRADATRAALIDAALSEFAAHGFEAASTRTIATAAETQQPQINYHFASKQALWQAAVDQLFERLDASVERHAATLGPAANPREAFAVSIRSFVRAVAELPELNRIMVHEATVESDRLRWIVERHTRPRFDAVIRAWREIRDRNEGVEIDDAVLFYTLVGSASLAYVNAPEARLLGFDTLDPAFIDAHANALVTMFLGAS